MTRVNDGQPPEDQPAGRPPGRPPIGPVFQIRFPPDLLAWVDEQAHTAGLSRSAYLAALAAEKRAAQQP